MTAGDSVVAHESVHQAIVAALSEMDDVSATREVEVPTKSGGKYTYRYADLADVLGYVRPILAKHGLVVAQSLDGDAARASVRTWIIHGSGGIVEFGPVTLRAEGTAQDVGSAYTYARRYALLAAMGLATEDDDAQRASGRGSGGGKKAAPASGGTATVPTGGSSFRTREEAQIKAAMDALDGDAEAKFNGDFVERFDSDLAGLHKSKHMEAWQWTRDRLGVE